MTGAESPLPRSAPRLELRVAMRRAAAGERAARAAAAQAGNPGWRITPMRAADLDAVRALDAAAFPGNPWQKGGYPAALARREAYVLRLADGTVAGVHVVREEGERMGLEKLAVRPDLRGRGLGWWLFRWGVLYAAETGAARAVLQVREDNARAIGIYQGAGLRVTRRLESHYPTGCPTALEMEIVLSAASAAEGAV
jgi:ribosomal-protein-alanine N-acetyltransferase